MSSTNRGKRGGGDDEFFITPAWCVHRLIDACPPLPRGRWIEPAAGNGAIILAIQGGGFGAIPSLVTWTAVEKRAEEHDAIAGAIAQGHGSGEVVIADFFKWVQADTVGRFNVAITNPPFYCADEYIAAMAKIADVVVVLQRLNFLAPPVRSRLFRRHMPDTYIIPNRPSFKATAERIDKKTGLKFIVKDPADSIEYGWFLWQSSWFTSTREAGQTVILADTPSHERHAPRASKQAALFDRPEAQP